VARLGAEVDGALKGAGVLWRGDLATPDLEVARTTVMALLLQLTYPRHLFDKALLTYVIRTRCQA
jgi:hypothetical protein